MRDLHVSLFGISARSLFSKSTHLNCVPPGVLLFPSDLHLSTCFCVRWSGILCKWPNRCSLFCLSWCSIGCSSVSLRTSTFRRLRQRVMYRRHLMYKVVNFLMSFFVTGQFSLHTVELTLLKSWILASWYAYWGCNCERRFVSKSGTLSQLSLSL